MIKLIVAIDKGGAIGRRGELLCHLRGDLQHFKQLTMGAAIIMGRKTWESFPRRPLPGRHNIIITRDRAYEAEGATVAHSLDEAIEMARQDHTDIWIIGGASVYREAMERGIVEEIELTRIDHLFADADAYFPTLDEKRWVVRERVEMDKDEKNEYRYSFERLTGVEPAS